MPLENCRIIELSKIMDPRGNLSFIESGQQIPFDIQRVYYLYDVPAALTGVLMLIKICISLLLPCRAALMLFLMMALKKSVFTSTDPTTIYMLAR